MRREQRLLEVVLAALGAVVAFDNRSEATDMCRTDGSDSALLCQVRPPSVDRLSALPSRNSGTTWRLGVVAADAPLDVVSRIDEGGVIFADGIEQDSLQFDWGSKVRVCIAYRVLRPVGLGVDGSSEFR